MNPTIRIAALLTCYNRCAKTLDCLTALYSQLLPDRVQLSVYLVDDGSTDGTSDAVQQSFPQVVLLSGNGQLFWNGGMRVAFAEAMQLKYDYYLWINDDTELVQDAIATLLSTAEQLSHKGIHRTIIVGSVSDPVDGSHTYGGVVRKSSWHPFHYAQLLPGDKPIECDTMNGNCVLIPQSVVDVVGNLDAVFTHGRGDFDYGLRAKQKGCSIWVAPRYVGVCRRNPEQSTVWGNPNIGLLERLKEVNRPKGLPFKEQKLFAYRHAGPLWPVFWILPYVRLILLSFKLAFKQQS